MTTLTIELKSGYKIFYYGEVEIWFDDDVFVWIKAYVTHSPFGGNLLVHDAHFQNDVVRIYGDIRTEEMAETNA